MLLHASIISRVLGGKKSRVGTRDSLISLDTELPQDVLTKLDHHGEQLHQMFSVCSYRNSNISKERWPFSQPAVVETRKARLVKTLVNFEGQGLSDSTILTA